MGLSEIGTTLYQIQVKQQGKYWENILPPFGKITEATETFDGLKANTTIPMRIVQTTSAIVDSWEPPQFDVDPIEETQIAIDIGLIDLDE